MPRRDIPGRSRYHPGPPKFPAARLDPRPPRGPALLQPMTFATTLICLSLACPQGGLRLPEPSKQDAAAAATVARPVPEVDRFRRNLSEMQGPAPKVDALLQEMAQSYPSIEPLVIEVARSARPVEMTNLMVVARRFGTPRIADELLFQLLARPLGDATRSVVETMATLKGADAKKALKDCIRGRIAAARHHAVAAIAPLCDAADLEFAVDLTGEQSLDLQLRGVDLLRYVPATGAPERLVQLLSKDPALAAAACQALVQVGDRSVPALQQLCAAPPIDRGFVYAAFALAQIADGGDPAVLPATLAAPLAAQVESTEALTRVLAAVPLADLAYRGTSAGPAFPDRRIVDALLEVVAPERFVPNLDLLRQPAEQRLVRGTGRLAGPQALSWRAWWADQREQFVGVRQTVAIDARNAASAVVTYRHEQRVVRLLGEALADVAPVKGALEVVLTTGEMTELTGALTAAGFGRPESMRPPAGLPLVRSLQVQAVDGRAQIAMPAGEYPQFDALVQLVDTLLDEQLWQLYRNPNDEPDRAAFWRTERRWLDANPEPIARGRRLLHRVVQNWAVCDGSLRARAIEHFFARRDRRELLGEQDGADIVAMLRQRAESGGQVADLELRLLELAAGSPGDVVWRDCVDFAANHGGRAAVRSVFGVLGPEALLAALQDQRPIVRRAAIDEVTIVRDLRAGARLVELLDDPDQDVRLAAAYAAGQLQIAGAARPLIAVIAAETTSPAMRRECLRSLGRVGGEQAFPVLQRAFEMAPQPEDKEAALRGLGELRDPRAAFRLAELAVIANDSDTGALARFYLRQKGGVLAVPALRNQLQAVQDPAIREQLVLMLGMYQDPEVVPDLIEMLRAPKYAASAAELLAATTGYNLLAENDRLSAIGIWWGQNRQQPQWQWLIGALQGAGIATTLRAEQFAPSAGLVAVPELARLCVDLTEPRLFVLTAAVLRSVTNEDFGIVVPTTTQQARESIAGRYRILVESARAAQGR